LPELSDGGLADPLGFDWLAGGALPWFWSEGGGVEFVEPGGVCWSFGGCVWDGMDVSLGGELAAPPGDVDC